MPFGARRFTQLVYAEDTVNGQRVGFYRARFVPLDFGDADELVTHEDLLRAVDDNAREPFPKPDAEERLALAAFNAQARNKTYTRAAVESVMARGQQRALVDVVDPRERTVIERWRGILARAKLPPKDQPGGDARDSSKHDFMDASRDVLALVDKYFPKPKGT